MSWLNIISADSFMPVPATKTAVDVDHLYAFLLISGLISFIILIGGMVLFINWYKRKTDSDKTPYISHNTLAEFLWSFIPLVIFLIIFYWGWQVFSDLRKDVRDMDPIEIHVTGRQWSWLFEYKNGTSVVSPNTAKKIEGTSLNEPVQVPVPVGRPVRLVITSNDVLHSFYVPAFRNKIDAVPGRYNELSFTANKTGDFLITCTEYCGFSHSNMMAAFHVVEPAEFDAWFQESGSGAGAELSLADKGQKLFEVKACASCHSVDGSRRVGPSLKAVFGHEVELQDGSKVKADENYLRESILQSQAKVVKGFPPAMPTFQGQLKDDEVSALIEYIKSLK